MRRALLLLVLLGGCADRSPELPLSIRLPSDRRLLAAVTLLDLSASRDGRVLAERSFSGDVSYVSVDGVPHGPRTVVALEGLTDAGDVIARGATCPIDFEKAVPPAPLYFAPVNFFAPTVGTPAAARQDPVALALGDGRVLLAGGADGSGPLASSEIFSPAEAGFAPAPALALAEPRSRAQAAEVPGLGVLITGGVGAGGTPLGDGEVFASASGLFVPLSNQALGARVGHRAVTLPDGRVLVTGGSDGQNVLASTVFVRLQPDGSATLTAGPPLAQARREHSAVVAVGVPVLLGGYDGTGQPLTSIEALEPGGAFQVIAHLQEARAEATATLLDDGSILVVGGVGASNTPLADAELFNPITQTTTSYPLAAARRGHTATLLPDGRVLIAGGFDGNGNPLKSVELFAEGIGFVSERDLGTPRAGHVAVPLCDGTVLVVGGGPGAEIYNPPAP